MGRRRINVSIKGVKEIQEKLDDLENEINKLRELVREVENMGHKMALDLNVEN